MGGTGVSLGTLWMLFEEKQYPIGSRIFQLPLSSNQKNLDKIIAVKKHNKVETKFPSEEGDD